MQLCGQPSFPRICIIPTSKQKRATQLSKNMEHDIETASRLKFFSTLEKRCSPEAQHLKLFLIRWHMFANCGSEIHSIDIYCWGSYGLSVHIPSTKTGSKAFLRCFAFPKDYPEKPSLGLQQFFHKERNSWVVSPAENKEGPNSTNLLFTFPKRTWPFLPSRAAFTWNESWVKLQYQQLSSIGCMFWKGIA